RRPSPALCRVLLWLADQQMTAQNCPHDDGARGGQLRDHDCSEGGDMGGPAPLPSASWLLDAALQHAEQAHTLLDVADPADWRGPAAVAYRHALAGLLAGTRALRDE